MHVGIAKGAVPGQPLYASAWLAPTYIAGPRAFRAWLTTTPEGRAMHDRRSSCVQNHTVLRCVRGWDRVDPDE